MSSKPEYRKYHIKYVVRAVVYSEVIAESFEKAKEKSDKTMSGIIFSDRLEVIDERAEFVGYDDMTTWHYIES